VKTAKTVIEVILQQILATYIKFQPFYGEPAQEVANFLKKKSFTVLKDAIETS
jgi:hypothetical protein